jgi:hypothetical protein
MRFPMKLVTGAIAGLMSLASQDAARATAVDCGPETVNGDISLKATPCGCWSTNEFNQCTRCSPGCWLQNGSCSSYYSEVYLVPVQKTCTNESGDTCTISWTETYNLLTGTQGPNQNLVNGCNSPSASLPSPYTSFTQSPCGCRPTDYDCQANCN